MTNLQAIVTEIQGRFRDLELSDPSALSIAERSGFDQDKRAKDVVQGAVSSLPESVANRIAAEYFGAGPLETLLKRDDITEIIVNGAESVWFESSGRLQRHDDQFLSSLTYRNFLYRVGREAGVQTSLNCPFADGHWNDFRLHLITPPACALESVLTLRKHPKNPWRLTELEKRGWASMEALACLRQLVERKKNFLIVGSTGSGKTSVLNGCLQELNSDERVVLIEDTSELSCPNSASTKLLTRKDTAGLLRDVDQTELLRQSLRMRPDRIVMGEIRGNEAKDLLMAFATGHSGCMGTMHADSARQALLRLEMLIQLGASQWSVHAVRSLVLLSLHAIVVVGRTADGSRRLEGIYRLASLEEVGFLLEKIA